MKKGLKSSYGEIDWKVGKWFKEEEISLCNKGFHASETPVHAMCFVNCEILARVEVRGKSDIQKDKQCWSEMKIVKTYKWTKKDSVSLAIYAADLGQVDRDYSHRRTLGRDRQRAESVSSKRTAD